LLRADPGPEAATIAAFRSLPQETGTILSGFCPRRKGDSRRDPRGEAARLGAVRDGPSRLKRPNLRLNAFAGTLSNLVYFGVVFLVTPLAVRHLGPERWGIWQLVGATAIYAQLLNLSLGTATHYQVAYRTAGGDYAGLATVLTNVRLYLLAVGVLLIAALALGGRSFVEALVPPAHVDAAWSALVAAIVLTSIDLQTRLAPSVLIGLQRNDVYALFQISGAVVLFLGVWLGFRGGMGITGFAAVMTFGPMFGALCSWVTYRRLLPHESLRWVRPDGRLFREMVSYSVSTILYMAGSIVLYQTMKFLAALRCGGPEAAGEMGLALSLAQTVSVVFTPAVGVLHSRVGQLHGERRLDQVSPLVERACLMLGLLLVPSIVFLVLDAEQIFGAWLGDSVTDATLAELAATTRLLFVGHGVYVAALPFYYALLGVGEHRVVGIGMLAVAVLNTGLGWLATEVSPRIETLGAVYGVLMLALSAGLTAPAGLRRFPLDVRRLLGRALVVPLFASLPGAALVAWRPRLGHPLLDVALDAASFAILTVPGLELARRRFALPLRFGSRG
jgi:O-antigen/teichoic acid export membrane protein